MRAPRKRSRTQNNKLLRHGFVLVEGGSGMGGADFSFYDFFWKHDLLFGFFDGGEAAIVHFGDTDERTDVICVAL